MSILWSPSRHVFRSERQRERERSGIEIARLSPASVKPRRSVISSSSEERRQDTGIRAFCANLGSFRQSCRDDQFDMVGAGTEPTALSGATSLPRERQFATRTGYRYPPFVPGIRRVGVRSTTSRPSSRRGFPACRSRPTDRTWIHQAGDTIFRVNPECSRGRSAGFAAAYLWSMRPRLDVGGLWEHIDRLG